MNSELRILFIGTPPFTIPVLESLLAASPHHEWKVVGILTQEDKKVGRKQDVASSPIKLFAQKHALPYLDPQSLRDPRVFADIQKLSPDIAVMTAYSKKIPRSILSLPKFQTIGIHPSLLPKYPGISPVQSAILAGEAETGITIFKLDEGFDSGPILHQETVTIEQNDTFQSLVRKQYLKASEVLPDVLTGYVSGTIKPVVQDTRQFIYTQKLTRDSGKIDWSKGDTYIERMIRAFYPWPGAWTLWKDKRLKIISAHLENDKLVPDMLQLEGSKALPFEAFIRGQRDFSVDALKN